MSRYDSISRRRFYRNREKAMLGGVCAGLADYFGFNLRVTRILAFIVIGKMAGFLESAQG